ncbi:MULTISPECIES: antibiotic biosynthesis monooxygenase [unclassified Exiguobacterium]|uniref:putative quinol monooxygenase n=1 Tax=unclassified Exiguobacterium TaxID=2644629 RepID=UPI0006AA3E8F|nr:MULTISPECIES: antibiotic biosynthesis monooxygenase [unclassified Exiguobacterium]KOP31469.1 antibiotic biosynthesis monooxygenase [Exiguobacterium sp. BMC-KP]
MSKYCLFTKFFVSENKREEMVDILLNASRSMEKLEECEIYVVSVSDEEANVVYVYEVWSNETSHKASLNLAVTQTLIQKAKPLLENVERVNTLQTKGGKGLLINK